jgi:hypothetical protein
MDSESYERADMKFIKIKGKRELVSVAEWEDIREIVKKDIKENKKFYAELALL